MPDIQYRYERLPTIPLATKEDKERFLNITRNKFKEIAKAAQPVECWYSITEKCNLPCRFCCASSGKPWRDELTTAQAYRVLNKIADAGTFRIVFGGGEPTLREDLLDLVRYAAREKGMWVAVNTNGLLLDREYAGALKQAGVMEVRISVDGLQESHDWVRGKGRFEKAVQTIKNCLYAHVLSVVTASVVSRLNYDEIPEIIKIALGLGVSIVIMPLIPEGRAKNFERLTLTKEQTRDLQRYLFKMQNIHGVSKIAFQLLYMISENQNALEDAVNPFRIGSYTVTPIGHADGVHQYAVSANGKAYAVGPMVPQFELCDLREQQLNEVWHTSEINNLLRDRDKLKGKCGRCEYRFVCGGSRRMAFAYTGDVMAEDPKCWYEPTLR